MSDEEPLVPVSGEKGNEARSPVLSLALLVLVTVGCLAPFANKAFHVDDPLFVWTARQIQQRPFDFYGFKVNWYGWEMPMAEVTKNPPLAAYYLAGAASVLGWGEIGLHLAFLLPALAAAAGTWFLAREFCSRPLLAALFAIVSPVFLISGTSVMCDTMMLAFWVWALWFWVRGLEAGRGSQLASACVLVCLGALTKYFGMALLPLMAVYALVQRKPVRLWLPHFLLPTMVLAAYQWATFHLYGRGLLLDAAAYSGGYRAWSKVSSFSELLVGLVFCGGCLAPVLFYTAWLWSKRALALLGVVAAAVLAVVVLRGQLGHLALHGDEGYRWGVLAQAVVYAFGGSGLLGLAGVELWRRRDASTLLLALWIGGTFFFASVVNWTVNGRSLLPMAPAAGILVARRLERLKTGWMVSPGWKLTLPLIPAIALGVVAARGDWRMAGSSKLAASELCRLFAPEGRRLWFEGHWGFQYYMELKGARPIDYRSSTFAAGDRAIIPLGGVNLEMAPSTFTWQQTLDAINHPWLTTSSAPAGAGFYADVIGPLPFALVRVQTEQYELYDVVAAGDFHGQKLPAKP